MLSAKVSQAQHLKGGMEYYILVQLRVMILANLTILESLIVTHAKNIWGVNTLPINKAS